MDETGALGLPPGIADRREALTPMLAQYAEICADYRGALVLFQVGDFYQAFCEAAEVLSRELELTLTHREDSTGTYPMAGIPIDNAASYLERLLGQGYRVALAEQVQDPAAASGPVERAVTRVVTPGTVIDDALLDPGASNYVACLTAVGTEEGSDGETEGGELAVAFADVSTGEFLVTSADRETITDELDRFDPAEVLVGPEAESGAIEATGTVRNAPEGITDYESAAERVATTGARTAALDRPEVRACGALLAYIEYTNGDVDSDSGVNDATDGRSGAETGVGIREDANGADRNTGEHRSGEITRYEPSAYLRVDATALRSLEVFSNRERGDERTLMAVLDESASALGRRRLADWVRRPLLDRGQITARHDAVEGLIADSLCREELRELLGEVYDLARLGTRVARGRASARDLRSLEATLSVIPEIREALASADFEADPLDSLEERLDGLADVRGLIDRAITADPPIELTEGGLIDPAFDEDLAALRETEHGGKEWVADLEATERDRTGIDSLSVGFNQVHGYYIEVTKANTDRVPEKYTRRQTLKNAERYYTPDLKRREDEIVSAGERADKREYELFREVRRDVGAEADRIERVAKALSELDALQALATVAVAREYVRPRLIGADEPLVIESGRHPVVEAVQESFVPNDTALAAGEVALVTGPNMAGKSTYMRQVALCVLLCQIGGFVPARTARLPIVDRIFTRVGAADDIAGGRSTFMREMDELATILREATSRSLVIVDEVGRGTSTTDGRAIARAAGEHLHEAVGARTLFATHYHELTDLATEYERITNYHFAADRSDEGGDVTFLHSVAAGAASASYGIDVARLAGVPDSVVGRSRALVSGAVADVEDERPPERETAAVPGSGAEAGNGGGDSESEGKSDEETGETHISVHDGREANGEWGEPKASAGGIEHGGHKREIEAILRELNIANTTPVEALCTLNELVQRLDDRTDDRQGSD
jgi:DNA mismatch repair protein MutS